MLVRQQCRYSLPLGRSRIGVPYTDFEEALALHNGVPQGLASSIFSNDVREVNDFCRRRVRIAGSSTSISGLAPRLAAPFEPDSTRNQARMIVQSK
jgi:hypothetical protein